MHKIKGKEFDNVFLVLNGFRQDTDAEKRLLYVAMTRAKNSLSIHSNSSFLDRIEIPGMEKRYNRADYGQTGERILLLGHKDIWLSDCAYRQRPISALASGDILKADSNGCRDKYGNTVVRFSNDFKKELAGFIDQNYSIAEAKVNFIVWWKGKDMEKAIMVVLPELHLVLNAPDRTDYLTRPGGNN